MNRDIKIYAALVVGGFLIAVAILPINPPYWCPAAFIEWAGAFLAFVGLSYLFSPKVAFFFGLSVFVLGSLGDVLFAGFNPIGSGLTNYMVFVHLSLGVLIGHIFRQRDVAFKS